MAWEAAIALSCTDDEESVRTMLLEDIKSLFAEEEATFLGSDEICASLGQKDDRPWPEWKNGKPMTPRQLATQLRPFGIRPTQHWGDSHRNLTGYKLKDCKDAFDRYTRK
jgi:putative DNA primase/helicase